MPRRSGFIDRQEAVERRGHGPATDGKIEIARTGSDLDETVELGLRFMSRYPRSMAALAK